ncbi:hypothetical protein RKD41_003497 [Streptomyces tendae]
MAQKVVVTLFDDIDGSEAAETIAFGLDGKSYEIDLNEANAKKLRKALAPYVEAGRKRSRSGKAYKQTEVAPRPRGRARLGPGQQDGGAGPRPYPQEGLRGVRLGAVSRSAGRVLRARRRTLGAVRADRCDNRLALPPC